MRFTPEEGLAAGQASTVGLTGTGTYADSSAQARLTAVVADAVPTLRDDEAGTSPGRTVSMDLLANDTAGAPSRPLQPSSARIMSTSAANLITTMATATAIRPSFMEATIASLTINVSRTTIITMVMVKKSSSTVQMIVSMLSTSAILTDMAIMIRR